MTHRATVVLDDSSDSSSGEEILALRPGKNLTTGERSFHNEFGAITSLERDILTLASSIFACDLAFKREERSEYPRKRIELTVPVTNHRAFQNPDVERNLRYALYKVSHDVWDISFVRREGHPEAYKRWPENDSGRVLLFSGGLDSMAAATLYGELGDRTYLSSHVTANQTTSAAQQSAFSYLEAQFPGQFSRVPFRVNTSNRERDGYPFPSRQAREPSQRTRSFLFLALASLVARRRGLRDIVVIAENGQMAIHLPLTAGRISAFSTHTAHPEFVETMAILMSKLLDYPVSVHNPFLYKTKTEVVKDMVDRHGSVVDQTVSCWKASRVSGELSHCGFCVPCLTRRIALEHNGLSLPEYQRDIFAEDIASLSATDEGKRNLIELAEFTKIFSGGYSEAALQDRYPELMNFYVDSSAAIDMYRRFSQEALVVFHNYPTIGKIIS